MVKKGLNKKDIDGKVLIQRFKDDLEYERKFSALDRETARFFLDYCHYHRQVVDIIKTGYFDRDDEDYPFRFMANFSVNSLDRALDRMQQSYNVAISDKNLSQDLKQLIHLSHVHIYETIKELVLIYIREINRIFFSDGEDLKDNLNEFINGFILKSLIKTWFPFVKKYYQSYDYFTEFNDEYMFMFQKLEGGKKLYDEKDRREKQDLKLINQFIREFTKYKLEG